MPPDDSSRPSAPPGKGRGFSNRSKNGQPPGRGRGRGGRVGRVNDRDRESQTPVPAPPKPPPDDLGGGGVSGQPQIRDAAGNGDQTSAANASEQQDVEADVCFICASPVVHNSVAPCNHRTCHICALRLRALYKTRACAHCRVSSIEKSPSSC